jgi:hypothetical protein
MGALLRRGDENRITLSARCLLGRHARCDVRVNDLRLSGEHASLHWMGERWELRDLGSRNGTFVQGRQLTSGERVPLAEGATFTLGGADIGFTLVDASAPMARARHTDGRVREAANGQLVLPSEEQPLVSVFEDASGAWVAELEDETRPVSDQDVVTVCGEAWTLELPEPFGATWHAGAGGPTIETVALRLGVSRDEEHVEITVLHGGKEIRLPTRSYHYLLVILARLRLGEHGASEAERGWVDRRELCRMLAVDQNKLGVDIFRVRKQLGALGIHGAADIVVRRSGTGQVRLGIERVELVSL